VVAREKLREEKDGILTVKGAEIAKVAAALASDTRVRILSFVKQKEADIGEIADLIKQSKANASAQVRILERAGLLKTVYKPGIRGVKKVCTTSIKEIRMVFE